MINPGPVPCFGKRVVFGVFVGALLLILPSCVKRARQIQVRDNPNVSASDLSLININIASRDDLAKLPGIGPTLATRIIEHRERFGRFRRTEHLIMVRGFSNSRFRALRSRVVVE